MTPEKQTLVLHVLNALAENPNISQRGLAKKMSIALGAANGHIQYCIRSGFVRKSTLGRTGYQITDKGWQIRREITAVTYENQLGFSKTLSEEYRTLVARLSQRGFTSFIIQGTNEMSNMAYVATRTMGMNIAGFLNSESMSTEYLGLPIIKEVSNLLPQQAILFTNIQHAQESFDTLSAQIGRRRVAIPEHLQELITTKEMTL